MSFLFSGKLNTHIFKICQSQPLIVPITKYRTLPQEARRRKGTSSLECSKYCFKVAIEQCSRNYRAIVKKSECGHQ